MLYAVTSITSDTTNNSHINPTILHASTKIYPVMSTEPQSTGLTSMTLVARERLQPRGCKAEAVGFKVKTSRHFQIFQKDVHCSTHSKWQGEGPGGQLEDKKSWPWPQEGMALASKWMCSVQWMILWYLYDISTLLSHCDCAWLSIWICSFDLLQVGY